MTLLSKVNAMKMYEWRQYFIHSMTKLAFYLQFCSETLYTFFGYCDIVKYATR